MRFWLILGIPAILLGQTPGGYFPLQAGNQWVYRVTGGFGRTITVTDTQVINDVAWAVVQHNPGVTQLLRSDGAGKVYSYNPDSQQEALLYDFTGGFPLHYSGPIGVFDAVGITSEILGLQRTTTIFAAGIGPVAQTTSLTTGSASLLPPARSDLIYARLGGSTVLTASEFSIALSMDRPVYSLSSQDAESCGLSLLPASPIPYIPCARIRLSLRQKGATPVRITLPSSQIYEMELHDSADTVVWRYSTNRTFLAEVQDLVIDGERTFTETVRLDALAPGQYRLVARLADQPGGSASASIVFTVAP
jgi:hypothetical protein